MLLNACVIMYIVVLAVSLDFLNILRLPTYVANSLFLSDLCSLQSSTDIIGPWTDFSFPIRRHEARFVQNHHCLLAQTHTTFCACYQTNTYPKTPIMTEMCFEPVEPLPCPAYTNRNPEHTLHDEHWKHRPPYAMHTEAEFGARWRGKCMCGRVTYILRQERPLNAKYCHCRGCQVLHGAPLQWAAIFHKKDMSFINGPSGLVFYSSTHQSQDYDLPTKVSCANCRTPIMDEGRNVCLLFPELIDLEGSDEEQRQKREPFKPTYIPMLLYFIGD